MILAGTGHRPNKLGGYSKEAFNKLVDIAEQYLIKAKPEKVICGMALGWDQALAQACINLTIPFIAAIPCYNQDKMWPFESKAKYQQILTKASKINYITETNYTPNCMQVRNKWMVDNADSIITLYDGTSGGTANCLNYAKSLNKSIINLYDYYLNY